jgi:hypothetical protein
VGRPSPRRPLGLRPPRHSGDPNSDREYLQDLPPADAEDASDDTELNDTDVAVEEGSALMDEEDER